MVLPADTIKVLQAFSGSWNYINASFVNETSGAIQPDLFGYFPAGITVYSPDGWIEFIIAVNQTTQPELRPALELNQDLDNLAQWALVGQNSVAIGGDMIDIHGVKGDCSSVLSGTYTLISTESTLITRIGVNFTSNFEFYDNCNTHVLRRAPENGLIPTLWFDRKRSKYTGEIVLVPVSCDGGNHCGMGTGYDNGKGYGDKKGNGKKNCKKQGKQYK